MYLTPRKEYNLGGFITLNIARCGREGWIMRYLRKYVTRGDWIALGCTIITMFFVSEIDFMRAHEGRQFLGALVVFAILDFICERWIDKSPTK